MCEGICLKKFILFFIIILPIVDQYKMLPLTFLEIIAILGFLYTVLKRNKIVPSKYLLFLTLGVFTTFFSTLYSLINYTNYDMNLQIFLLRMIKYCVIIVGIVDGVKHYFDVRYALMLYRKIVLIVSGILTYQFLMYKFFNKAIYFLIPNATLNYGNGINSSEIISSVLLGLSSGYYFRPSSIFIEPAYYAAYVLPYIAIVLFRSSSFEKEEFILLLYCSLNSMLTTSTLAFVSCLILWILWIYKYIRENNLKVNILPLILILITITFVFYKTYSSDAIMISLLIKLKSLNNLDSASSLTLRLFRGGYFYSELDSLLKIIGVGYGNLSSYYHGASINLIYDSKLTQISYMSGFFTILNSFGIIGIIAYAYWMLSLFLHSGFAKKGLLIIFIVFILTSDCYESPEYWILYTFLEGKFDNGSL